MPLAIIDYEKVDLQLLNVIHMLKSIESMVASANISTIPNTGEFLAALDSYRNECALEIEQQGSRK
jgi:hypothetical protein